MHTTPPAPVSEPALLHLGSLPETTSATYSPHGLAVRAGTIVATPDPADDRNLDWRVQRLVLSEMGVAHMLAGCMTFARDHTVQDPSTAARISLGRSSNGWEAW